MDVTAGRSRTCATESVVKDSEIRDLRNRCPSPSDGPSRSTLAANLIEEQPPLAVDDAVVVRFGASCQPMKRERYKTPLGDCGPNELIDARCTRAAHAARHALHCRSGAFAAVRDAGVRSPFEAQRCTRRCALLRLHTSALHSRPLQVGVESRQDMLRVGLSPVPCPLSPVTCPLSSALS